MQKIIVSFFVILSFVFAQSASETSWKTEYNQNNIVVKMAYPEIVMPNGDAETMVKWRLEAEKKADFRKIIQTIKSVELHKKLFENCEESRIISENDTSSIVYYYFDHPWPAPNLDNVRLTKSRLDTVNQVFYYSQTSDPALMEMGDCDRININNIRYVIKKIADDKVSFEIEEEFVAEGAPMFMVKSMFPESPVEFLERILEHSK